MCVSKHTGEVVWNAEDVCNKGDVISDLNKGCRPALCVCRVVCK